MAKDEIKQYTGALEHFSDAIYHLSESIKNSVAHKKSDDVQSSIANNAPIYEQISKMSESILEISKSSTETKSNTESILAEIKSLKKSKENGFFEKLSGTKKTKGMVEGIKSITMMAGGLMAIGLAFQLIGNVDFSSVLALSIALPLVAYSFEKIGKLKMTVKDYGTVSAGLVIMSSGLLITGEILKSFPQISLMSIMSMIGVSVGMSIISIGLASVANTIDIKKIANIVIVSATLPAVAAGLVASSHILKGIAPVTKNQVFSAILTSVAVGSAIVPLAYAYRLTKNLDLKKWVGFIATMPAVTAGLVGSSWILQLIAPVTLDQTLSSLFTSLAISAAMIPLSFAYGLTKKMDLKDWYLLVASMPVIASGIVVTSYILQGLNNIHIDNPFGMVLYALTSGLAILAYGGVMATFSKIGLNIKTATVGVISMSIVAVGLVAASHILSFGKWNNYPSAKWALGVGTAFLLTLPTIIAYGAIAMSGIGIAAIALGIVSMISVATGLVGISHILSNGKYSNFPNLKWALGVGTALGAFGIGAIMLGTLIVGSLGLGYLIIDQGLNAMVKIAHTMNSVGAIISKGTYSGGPTKQWAEGVGLSIASFALALAVFKPGVLDMVMSFFGGGTDNMQMIKDIATLMPIVADQLREGNYTGGPSPEWANGTALSIKYFAQSIGALSKDLDYDDVKNWILPVKRIGSLIPYFATRLEGLKFGAVPSKNWSEGIRDFLNAMTGVRAYNMNEKTIDQIRVLSDVFIILANSLSKFSKSLWSLNGAPSLTSIYEGIALMSVIDPVALNNVINGLNENDVKVNKIISNITSVGDGSKGSTFSGKQDKMPKPKGKTNSKPEGNINPDNTGKSVKGKMLEVNPVNKSNELLEKIYNILTKSNSSLDNIKTNTAKEKQSKIA